MTRTPIRRLGLAALLTAVLLALAGSPAWAHGPKAYTLVREAIALMVNSPNDHAAILAKIDAALRAEDKSGVQIPLVLQARSAFEAGDVHQAQRLLEQSIGAQVHTAPAEPVPINTPPPSPSTSPSPAASAGMPMPEASGSPTGLAADLPGRRGLTGGDWTVMVISLLVVLAGIVLAATMRPHLPRHLAGDTETAR